MTERWMMKSKLLILLALIVTACAPAKITTGVLEVKNDLNDD